MGKIIRFTLQLLLVFIPLTFTTVNYELFEFPKFLLLLSGAIILTVAWGIDLYQRQLSPLIVIKNLLTTPSPHRLINQSLIIILVTQTLATLFSLHPYTSWWGYYSRFHQGLLTTTCYTLIYFSALNYMDNKSIHKLIKITISTSILISLYAILQRFGIDQSLWVQDVVNRPFSTLGQPNWLAAYLLPHLFLTLFFYFSVPKKSHKRLAFVGYLIILSALFLTKSRSGLLALSLAYPTYWLLSFRNLTFPKLRQAFLTISAATFLTAFLIGTPYTPSALSLINVQKEVTPPSAPSSSGTQLENGGTESGDIRKIVWTGALQIFNSHPLLGTGPETFAYTYYQERPLAHNYTSEWDFLYNKAHNEYLNFAATTGILGLGGYLFWHYAVLNFSWQKVKPTKKVKKDLPSSQALYLPVLAASIVSFTVTSFFGFSVIPVYLITLLLPILTPSNKPSPKKSPLPQSLRVVTSLLVLILILLFPIRLFFADLAYTQGKNQLDRNNFPAAEKALQRATTLRGSEDLYHASLAETYAQLSVTTGSLNYQDLALEEIKFTKTHNPHHLNLYKSRAKAYLTLALSDPAFYQQTRDELIAARALAPTDPKLAYNLGLVYSRLSDLPHAIKEMEEATKLKNNYYEPYYALTLLYENTKDTAKLIELLKQAKENFPQLPEPLAEKAQVYLAE